MLKSGDTIKCSDAEDMIETMNELEKYDIQTDFLYEKDGESGAITKDKNYFNHFERVENELKKLGFSCINPAKINSNMPDDFTHEDYMKISFALLDMCKTIYMLDGWKDSCGACQEYGYALAKGYSILFER